MRNMLIVAAALVALGPSMLHAAEPSKSVTDEIADLSQGAADAKSLDAISLRERFCGGPSLLAQDARNAAFAACTRYVLGAVNMIREWQRIDPTHAPSTCIPRTVSASFLLSVIQGHIEAKAPWYQAQFDASPAIIAALVAKWPCQNQR